MAIIDRDYWLEFARESVSKSIQTREDAATKLDEFLSWIWTIYTSIFALASLLGYVDNDIRQLLSISQPILFIMWARLACKIVAMPSVTDSQNADPNVVPEIIESFQLIVADKKRKLRWAVFLTFVSMFSICIALIGYNLFDSNKEIKINLQAAKLKKDLHDQNFVDPKSQQLTNDDLKLKNDFLDLSIQNEIKRRKLECVKTNDQKCLDSLKMIEK